MDFSGAKVIVFSYAFGCTGHVVGCKNNRFQCLLGGPVDLSGAKVIVFRLFSGAPDMSSGVKAIGFNTFRVDSWTSRVQK